MKEKIEARMMPLKTKTRIEIFFPNQKSLVAAMSAISHEGKIETDRSQVKITKITKSAEKLGEAPAAMVIEITANDIVALRASMNAYLRALQAFEGIENQGDDGVA